MYIHYYYSHVEEKWVYHIDKKNLFSFQPLLPNECVWLVPGTEKEDD